MPNEMVLIGDYYIERDCMNMIYNQVREDLLTQQRREMRVVQRERDERSRSRKEDRIYFIKQKLYGVFLILFSIIIAILSKDLTGSVIFIPLGIAIIRSKDRLIM